MKPHPEETPSNMYAKSYRWKEQQRERRIELMERNEHYGTMEDIAAKEFERELVETMPNWFAEIMEEAVRRIGVEAKGGGAQ